MITGEFGKAHYISCALMLEKEKFLPYLGV